MMMWMIIMWTTLASAGMALLYLSNRVCRFGFMDIISRKNDKLKGALGVVLVFGLFAIIGIYLNFMNAIVCAVYFALIWLFCDIAEQIIKKIGKLSFKCYYFGVLAAILSISALGYGWYLDHNVWKTEYNLTTSKAVSKLKIAMFADSHIGTTFDAAGFAEHLKEIEKQNPDIVVVVGDFVDDDTNRENMEDACKALGQIKTKYGVYFAFGNHDKGYYGSARRGFSWAELIEELQKNGVKVLFDETVDVNGEFYLVGRKDFSEERENRGNRKSMREITDELDTAKYIIVSDHQPADYKNQENSEVDLVLSGHTHGGQLFPFNSVGKWIGANDMIYGHEKRKNTDFIVTSGISDWAIKFKTGTKSEYVIINIIPEK